MTNDKILVFDGLLHNVCNSIRIFVSAEAGSKKLESKLDHFLQMQPLEKRGEVTGTFYSFSKFLYDTMPSTGKMNILNLHVRKAIHYLDHHVEDPHSLKKLVDCVGMSSSALCRLFRSHTSTTMGRYLYLLRMKRAIHLLVTTDEMVLVIGEKCGYSCTSYFIREFKKYTGYTPLSYRRKKK